MNPMAIAGAGLSNLSWAGSTLNSSASARTRDHDVGYQFLVMIGFAVLGEFLSVDGISREVETEAIHEGGRSHGPHVRIKHGKEGTLTLKFGMMDRSALWDWMEMVRVGVDFRREVQVVQFNRAFKPVRTYTLMDAFPRRVKAGGLDAGSTNLPVDEIEIVFDRLVPIIIPQSGEAALSNLGGAVASLPF